MYQLRAYSLVVRRTCNLQGDLDETSGKVVDENDLAQSRLED
jgi:hypothetical protein